jgi:4-hydroxythreonine-4-phosphate dehydrogenase
MLNKPVIGITTGDLNGVGPEIIIKTFSDIRMLEFCIPVIFASPSLINFYKKLIADTPFNYTTIRDFDSINHKTINLFHCWEEEIPIQPGTLTDTGGKYAVRSLQVAAQCLKDGQLDAVVTAPIHKSNTHLTDFPFTLLYTDELRMGLVTEHVPVAEVSALITRELLQSKIHLLKDTLIRDFGLDKPRIAVLALNPHAGDEGKIGMEEQTVIRPVLEGLQQQGHTIYGPYSADAFFARRSYTQFDAVLAMYHDQGLIPFKTIAGSEGVNYTAGLPVIRTSPDHGTAFDIAGKDKADPSSFREAVFQAVSLLEQRGRHGENTASPLRRGRSERERNHSDRR